MFQIADETDDGVLEAAEATKMLTLCDFNIPTDTIQELVTAAVNDDGLITYGEFVPVVRKAMQSMPLSAAIDPSELMAEAVQTMEAACAEAAPEEAEPVAYAEAALEEVEPVACEEAAPVESRGPAPPLRSMVPVSTQVYESCTVNAPVDTVWDAIRSMDFAYSELMCGGELVSGECANAVGSVHKLHFHDGSEWMVQVIELSDFDRTLVLDLLERSDGVEVASCTHQIVLHRVSQGDQTMVEYTVDFSNDADAQICQDTRFKRQAELKAMQEYFGLKAPAATNCFHPSDFTTEELDGYLNHIFQIADETGDGVLEAAEVTKMLTFCQFDMSADAVEQMAAAADVNDDGLVTYGEFVPVLRKLLQATTKK